eukprot:s3158_g7.t2
MAHSVVPTYLDRVLTTPTDNSLLSHQTHGDLPQALMRPPDINTLTDWGYLKAPSGKHATKTFAAIYELDQGYVNQMWNRRGVSSWVRSFQMYSRARRSASEEARRRMRMEMPAVQTPVPPPRSPMVSQAALPGPSVMTKASMPPHVMSPSPKSSSSTGLEEWTKIPVETPIPNEVNKGKRGLVTQEQSMSIQPDTEKVGKLQTQIAILQRELQKELKGSKSEVPAETN